MKRLLSSLLTLALSMSLVSFSWSNRSLASCTTLAEIKALPLHTYSTGILTRSSEGKIVLTFGTLFDSHSILLNHASTNYGRVDEILWAGEIKAEKNKILIVNETAGIIIRPTPSVRVKTSDVQNLVTLYEKYPKLRRLFAKKPTLIHFDSSLPEADLHLFRGLDDIARFRHDIQGVIATFTSLADVADAGFLSDRTVQELNEPMKQKASEILKLIEIAERFQYGSADPADPGREGLKSTLREIESEGFGTNRELTVERFKMIKNGAQFLTHQESGIFSIFIESSQ